MPRKPTKLDRAYQNALKAAKEAQAKAPAQQVSPHDWSSHHKTERQPGEHVTMNYRGRTLLGEIVSVNQPRNPKAYPYLTIKHFNGEYWPIEPLASEVHALERTYPKEDES